MFSDYEQYMPIYEAKTTKIHIGIGLLIVHHVLCVLMLTCLSVNLVFHQQPIDCIAWMATTVAITQS